MSDTTRFTTPKLPFDTPQPPPCQPAVEETSVPANESGAHGEERPSRSLPPAKKHGYQIFAKKVDVPNDPGTASYTKAVDEAGAVERARRQFPPEKGWHEHGARLLPDDHC